MPRKFSKPHLSRLINGDIIAAKTPEAPVKTRLDRALQMSYPDLNRATIQKYITAGQVTVNQLVTTKPSTPVTEVDDLKVHMHFAPPKPPKIPIIYEDADVIVLNKPAGLLTISKGAFNPEPTLEPFGHIVHRLDRDTSGVIILAKNPAAKTFLQKQFAKRTAQKTYHAIVIGHPQPPAAIIDIPLARNLKHPTTFIPHREGRAAITEYRTIRCNSEYSLLELRPRTGRTHQLRVHLSHLGTPILGDRIYGHTPSNQSPIDRMYLHATSLEITLPGQNRQIFTVDPPQDFQNVLV